MRLRDVAHEDLRDADLRVVVRRRNNIRNLRFVRIADHPLHAWERGNLIGRALCVTAGDEDLRFRIIAMDAADGVAQVVVGAGGDSAGIEDNKPGGIGGCGRITLAFQQGLNRGAIGLRGTAAEVFHHETVGGRLHFSNFSLRMETTIGSGVKITISKENYLKAIAEAQSEGETVIAATLARWLNVSPPAVTMAIRRLKRDGLIEVAAGGTIQLTTEGRKIANEILLRHHLIERMLTEVFGMEWYKVHDEAERLEHAVSGDFEKLLALRLGSEHPCPHGNLSEIDSPAERRARGWRTLDEVEAPSEVSVVSVYERDRALLERLDRMHVKPGAKLKVTAKSNAQREFRVGSAVAPIAADVARKIWVN